MLMYEDLQTSNDLELVLSFLDEAYFGKSKELIQIEKILDQYRKKYLGKYFLIGSAANTDKLLIKINRLFEEQFGFGNFALFIIDSSDINAFTFAIDNRYDTFVNKNSLVSAKSFKFNKDRDYAVITCIYAGLIFNPELTTEEILGIILHEIGHNFYAALSTTNTVFSSCDKAIGVVETVHEVYKIFKSDEKEIEKVIGIATGAAIISPVKVNTLTKTIVKAIKKANEKKTQTNVAIFDCLSCFYIGIGIMKLARRIYQWIIFILAPIKSCGIIVKKWIERKISTIKDPFHILRLPNGFRNERTADNFAAMYGYGPALSSGLMKMEMHESDPDNIANLPKIVPFIGCLFDSLLLPFRLIETALDPHPLTIQRTTDQIRMLNEELNKSNLDPKMKKRIQKDIDKITVNVNKSIDTSRSITTDPNFIKHLVNRIMYNTVEGKSIRDVIFNFDPNGKYKSYDKVIDDLYKQNTK